MVDRILLQQFLIFNLRHLLSCEYLDKGLHLSCGSRSGPFSTRVQRWTSAPTDPKSHSAATQDSKQSLHHTYPNQCSHCLKKYWQLRHLQQKDGTPAQDCLVYVCKSDLYRKTLHPQIWSDTVDRNWTTAAPKIIWPSLMMWTILVSIWWLEENL